LTLQPASLQRKRSSSNRKTASAAASIGRFSNKQESYVSLLPETIGILQEQPDILTESLLDVTRSLQRAVASIRSEHQHFHAEYMDDMAELKTELQLRRNKVWFPRRSSF
jgi:hypothetical protein